MNKKLFSLGVAAILAAVVARMAAAATGPGGSSSAEQPYIDSLKQKYGIKQNRYWGGDSNAPGAPNTPVSPPNDTGKTGAQPSSPPTTQQVQPYIESFKKREGVSTEPPLDSQSVQPYIESVKAGRELEPRFPKKVTHAAGFSIVATNHYNASVNSNGAANFDTVYQPNSHYDFGADIFYEQQFYRNPYVGALGVVGHVGVLTTKGKGVFLKTGATSDDTTFRFFAVPMTAGLSYHFTQLRIIEPFAQAGLAALPFYETRSDQRPNRKALSAGYSGNIGVALNLDWISRKNAWAQYDSSGVVHTYLMAQYQMLRTLGGAIDFSHDGIFVGIMTEF